MHLVSTAAFFEWIFDRIEDYDRDDIILNSFFKISKLALEIISRNKNLNVPSFKLCQELFITRLLTILEFVASDDALAVGLECMIWTVDLYPGILTGRFVPLVSLLIGISVDTVVPEIYRSLCQTFLSHQNLVESWPDNLDYFEQIGKDFSFDIQLELKNSSQSLSNDYVVSRKIMAIAETFLILADGLLHDFNLALLVQKPQFQQLFKLPIYTTLAELSLISLDFDLFRIGNDN